MPLTILFFKNVRVYKYIGALMFRLDDLYVISTFICKEYKGAVRIIKSTYKFNFDAPINATFNTSRFALHISSAFLFVL